MNKLENFLELAKAKHPDLDFSLVKEYVKQKKNL